MGLDITDFSQAKGTADGSFGPSEGINMELGRQGGTLGSHRVPVVPKLDSSHLCFNTKISKGFEQLNCICTVLQLLNLKEDCVVSCTNSTLAGFICS